MKIEKIYQFAILLKELNDPNLQFIKVETPICNLYDFCEMVQQQIRSGEMPIDGNIVGIYLSGIQSKYDWSDAPFGTVAYAIDKDGSAHWYIGGSPTPYLQEGKFLMEGFMRRVPAPYANLGCEWYESLIHKPN